MRAKMLLLLLGVLIGLGAAVLFPRLRDGLTPGVLKRAPTEGIVEEKRGEEDRLLLTLVTPEGAVLATFTRKVAEIDLLVAPGDTVSLSLDGYRPFVEDPEIERVVKAPPHEQEPPPLPAADGPAEPQAESATEQTVDSPVDPQADPEVERPVDPGPDDP